MKKSFIVFITLFLSALTLTSAQNNPPRPKLVVGIVIDQMRYDYLYRFENLYGENGFKKLLNGGTNFTYTHFNYVPTYTAPGHTSIYTGTTPFYHGIIANSWYDRDLRKSVYCTGDNNEKTVGADDNTGEMSPHRLLSTTITDQLKLGTNNRSKVISISLKDRAAILMGGHFADAAYWYDYKNGKFVTSTYYMKNIPEWVEKFNSLNYADKYLNSEWTLSYPIKKYQQSTLDDEPYERDVFSEGKTSFPHSFKNVKENKKYDLLRDTPFANDLQYQFVKEAIINEKLGKHSDTDFLAVSFCASDFVGHDYGPNSVEVEDLFIKIDSLLADLIRELDNQVGKGNYLLFLTADHAVADSPVLMAQQKYNVKWFDSNDVKDSLKSFSVRKYDSEDIIEDISNKQVFLNYKFIASHNLYISDIRKQFKLYLVQTFKEISVVFTSDELSTHMAERETRNFILNGFNSSRSGDVVFELQPGILSGSGKWDASTHGSMYSYDTHVPLIFYGWNIEKKTINDPVFSIDIAPTVADMLKIQEPNACIGIPLLRGGNR
ncbi:MAG TPA: alkaline phosphatase PafA [Ignavibacteriaceae bacterium]|nr:alkaline phosphatase PafA [Ignavibacteriaceae bacterium]